MPSRHYAITPLRHYACIFMKKITKISPLLITLSAVLMGSALAQTTPPATTGADADAVRSALAKKEGEGEGESKQLLQDTLTAKDRQYSLLKSGKYAMAWDASYAYSGVTNLETSTDPSTARVNNVRSHTITNSFSVDYGLLDNLTVNLNAPLVNRFTQSDTTNGNVSDLGDMSLGARFQPFPLTRDMPTITLNTSVRLPTGSSPFKTFDGQGLASGSGVASLTGGINVSKIMDPAALFGSVSLTHSMKASNLSQNRSGDLLTEVAPGSSVSWGAGFASALSYRVSTSLSFQQTISSSSKFTFRKPDNSQSVRKSVSSTSAMLNFGLGLRNSPTSSVNFTLGVGLTSDSPDFTFGMNMPLSF